MNERTIAQEREREREGERERRREREREVPLQSFTCFDHAPTQKSNASNQDFQIKCDNYLQLQKQMQIKCNRISY